jgi:hypothetical protein
MNTTRENWKRRHSLEQIQAILKQSSYIKDVSGKLPNGEEKYTTIEANGFKSMKEDKDLLQRVHFAAGGRFGLPKGGHMWLEEDGSTFTQ